VLPRAAEVTARTQARLKVDPDYVPERSIYIIVRDYEQEAEFVLMLWCISLMGYKARLAFRERQVLDMDLIPLAPGTSILPDDAREYSRPIQALSGDLQECLLPRTLLTALHRFRSTRSVQDVSEAVRAVCVAESERQDSELSMIRYAAWAIPSIGFLGTVRGIGQAMAQAYKAREGDLTGVVDNLGLAFNSTLVALLISMFLMFLLHWLQLLQERVVLDTQTYADRKLIQHMQTQDSV
jgi:biopolymer transport protein ExbB/TolQ